MISANKISGFFKRIIYLKISCLLFIWDKICFFLSCIIGKRRAGRCAIIYYHAVPDECVAIFARHVKWIVANTKPVSSIKDVAGVPFDNCVQVTFDDGYESVVKNALPILHTHSVPCTFFIPTGSLGERPKWVTRPDHPYYVERVVDSHQIKHLAQDPLVRIGSHGVNHKYSTKLTIDEFVFEIRKSKETLDALTPYPVTEFSFPHGKYSTCMVSLLEKEGYTAAYSLEPRTEYVKKSGFVLGRFHIDFSEWKLEFLLKIAGAYRWQKYAHSMRKNND